MDGHRGLVAVVALAATAIVAACGSTSPTTPGATSGTGPTGGTTPTQPPTATQAPIGTTGNGGPGTGTGDACDLLTLAEVVDATGAPNVEVQDIDPSTIDGVSGCSWVSGGVLPVIILVELDPANTNTDPAGYLALPGSEEVSISGARAVFAPAAGNVTFVFKGAKVITIQVGMPKNNDFKSTGAALAQKVADRM